MQSNASSSGHWFFIVFGVVAIALGSRAIVKPRAVWRPNRWQYKNAPSLEPSSAALVFTRCIGVFFIAVAIVMIVAGIKQF